MLKASRQTSEKGDVQAQARVRSTDGERLRETGPRDGWVQMQQRFGNQGVLRRLPQLASLAANQFGPQVHRKCSCGGSSCPTCSGRIQMKSEGGPQDGLEQEADSVADRVTRTAENEPLRRQSYPAGPSGKSSPGPGEQPAVQRTLRSPGEPLD